MRGGREAMAAGYITEALLQLMKKKEYRDISVTEVCAKAGVTRMSFYRNFRDREEVLRGWIRAVTDAFLGESGISYKNDPPGTYFVKLFTHLGKYREICLALYRAGLIHIVKEQFDRVFLEIHREEYDDYKSCFLSGGVYNVFYFWLVRGCAESPAELAERLEGLLVK